MQVDQHWLRLAGRDLEGNYQHAGAYENDDNAEYVVPVQWLVAVPTSDAFWEKGMFANQNSACKLRQEFTLDRLAQHFSLDELEPDR